MLLGMNVIKLSREKRQTNKVHFCKKKKKKCWNTDKREIIEDRRRMKEYLRESQNFPALVP